MQNPENDENLEACNDIKVPTLVDCQTFRNLLNNFSASDEETKAAEQLLNIFKVQTIGE